MELVRLYAKHYNYAVPLDEDVLGVLRLDSELIRHEGPRVHQPEVAFPMTAAHEIRNPIEL